MILENPLYIMSSPIELRLLCFITTLETKNTVFKLTVLLKLTVAPPKLAMLENALPLGAMIEIRVHFSDIRTFQ